MSEKRQLDAVMSLSDFSVINSQFTRARCRIMYTGKNRNRTNITDEALNKLINRKGYANVPVVAHLYKDDDGKWRVGGHDSKFVISSDGDFEIINETIPFGVIPESCNPSFEDVTERSGEVKRYFCVDIILWTHRYNIMDAVKSDEIWFNQSMEITYDDYCYDNDNYCTINDFNLSALCLLNHDPYNKEKEVEPCFPSSIVTEFNLNNFKKEFNILYDKLNQLIFNRGAINLDIEQLKSKLDGKYLFISATPDSVIAMSKEGYELFEISYAVNTTNSEIVFDYAKATKRYVAVSDKEQGISLAAVGEYVEDIKNVTTVGVEKMCKEKYEAEKAAANKELADKYSVLLAENTDLKSKYDKAVKAVEGYEAAEKKAAEDKHKAEINSVIAKFESQLSGNSDFWMYKNAVDYSKTTEQVEQDLYVILGKQAKNGGSVGGTTNFSASWGANTEQSKSRVAGGRYGDLFDKFVD